MARLATSPVQAADIEKYLATYSDFAFELEVLHRLSQLGLDCRHGGTYEDPVTKKAREFDIHATSVPDRASKERRIAVRLAIECKNLRPNYPLVVHRVPRRKDEAFTDVIWSVKDSGSAIYTPMRSYGKRIRLRGDSSIYTPGEWVGKSADQVGKRPDGELVTGDADVFDKISQAINSAYELMRSSHYASLHDKTDTIAVVLPMLVIPDERLWAVDYDVTGEIVAGPARVPHVSYFVDRDWSFGGDATEYMTWYSLSHLEICEAGALPHRIHAILADSRLHARVVLDEHMKNMPGPKRST